MSKVRVLITDDSNLMRKLLSNIVSKDDRLEVIGTAENGQDAIEKIKALQPDVVTLDLNMPVMDGLTCLKEAKAQSLTPAFLVVSSLAQKDAQITIDAINEGALDYIPKPSQMLGIGALEKEITNKILMVHQSRQDSMRPSEPEPASARSIPGGAPAAAAGAPASVPAATAVPKAKPRKSSKPKLTIFGGSSGSMRIVQKLAPQISPKFAGVCVFVLHLPPFFTSQLVVALRKLCKVPVEEAADGTPVALRKIYVAPGGEKNIVMGKNPAGKGIIFQQVENDQMLPHTPSIDVFMESSSRIFKDACRGILISGIGTDGIEGLRAIRANRGEAFVQDRASAVANQLPLAALNAGVAQGCLDLQDMADLLK